jgi:hypothetical protein
MRKVKNTRVANMHAALRKRAPSGDINRYRPSCRARLQRTPESPPDVPLRTAEESPSSTSPCVAGPPEPLGGFLPPLDNLLKWFYFYILARLLKKVLTILLTTVWAHQDNSSAYKV